MKPDELRALPDYLRHGLAAIDDGGSWCAYAPREVGQCAARLVERGLVTIRVQHGDWFVRRTAAGDAALRARAEELTDE
jgi:hypothetical protein